MLEDALAAAAQERDAVASAFAERRALLRSLRMLRRCTPSLHKLTDKQQRGVLGVHRRRSHRLAFEALFVWSRRTMARRRADRVLVRVTAAVDRKRTRRQLRCWRDGARRARRAERAVTYSMLVVVGRASHAFHTWRCVARRRSDAQVPRHPLYTTRPRAIHTASPSLWARAASAHLANTTCPTTVHHLCHGRRSRTTAPRWSASCAPRAACTNGAATSRAATTRASPTSYSAAAVRSAVR